MNMDASGSTPSVRTVEVPPGYSVRLPATAPGFRGEQVRTSDLERVLHQVKVIRGTGEVCGHELAHRKEYELHAGDSAAVTSLVGCTLEIKSQYAPQTADVNGAALEPEVHQDKGSIAVANLHARLHALRAAALAQAESGTAGATSGEILFGPRVMLVSATPDAGRSSMLKTLANYAIRQNHTPLFVDVAVDNPTLSIPGTLGAMPMVHPLEPTAGLSLSTVAAVASSVAALPVLYWLGADHVFLPTNSQQGGSAAYSSGHGVEPAIEMHYLQLVRQLSKAMDARCAQDVRVRASGALIDVPSGIPVPTLVELVRSLHVTHILGVTGGDASTSDQGTAQLIANLRAALANVHIRPPTALSAAPPESWGGVVPVIGTLPRSGATAPKSPALRKFLHIHKIREYFHGLRGKGPALTPHHIHVPPSILHIARIEVIDSQPPDAGNGVKAEEGTNPTTDGFTSTFGRQMLTQVPVTDGNLLMHSVLAVSTVDDSQKEEAVPLATSNVIGFVYIADYNEQRAKLNMLVPFPGRLPRLNLVWGTIKWIELS